MTQFETLQEFEYFYDAMMPAQENDLESFTWYSGIPHLLFNAVMHIRVDRNTNEKVDHLLSQAPTDTPLSFWIHHQNKSIQLVEGLKERGFQSIIICPLMTWIVKPADLPKYEIKPAELDIFHHLLAFNFHLDENVRDGYARLLEKVNAEHYLIYLDGHPIGTGTLFPNGKIGGIFNLAILPEYQKRGCGRAMMHFLMNRASIIGLEKLILLSSPVAEKLYSNLGFTKCFDIEIYAR